MVQLCVLGFVLFFACYGQFESGLSAYGVEAAGISTSALGTALAANTAMIVVAQFAVLKFVERRRRSRVIAAVGLIWAVAWVAAGYAGLGHGSQDHGDGRVRLHVRAVRARRGDAVADRGAAGRRSGAGGDGGQYNSAFALVKQLALAVGPAVGGPMGAVAARAVHRDVPAVLAGDQRSWRVRLGRQLTPVQDQPSLAKSRVVAQGGAPAESVAACCDARGGAWEPATARHARGRANSHQTALPPPGVRREPQVEAIVATMAMPRPASSPGSARRRRGQVVVAVGHLDDQSAVGAAQPQAHGRGAVLEGVGDQFAGGQDAQVVQLRREAPAGQDAGGEGTRAWGRFDAAEQFQGGVAEELAVGARAGGVLEDQDGHVVVVVGGDAGASGPGGRRRPGGCRSRRPGRAPGRRCPRRGPRRGARPGRRCRGRPWSRGRSGIEPEACIQPPVPSGGPVGSSARRTVPFSSRTRMGRWPAEA